MMRTMLVRPLAFAILAVPLAAQDPEIVRYREVDGVELVLHVDRAVAAQAPTPGVVFFFGGGWNGGTVEHFAEQARYLTTRGITCFRADYRVKSRQGTTPRDAAARSPQGSGGAAALWLKRVASQF